LVPGCTGGVLLYGLLNGKLKDIWGYKEEDGREKKAVVEDTTATATESSELIKEDDK